VVEEEEELASRGKGERSRDCHSPRKVSLLALTCGAICAIFVRKDCGIGGEGEPAFHVLVDSLRGRVHGPVTA